MVCALARTARRGPRPRDRLGDLEPPASPPQPPSLVFSAVKRGDDVTPASLIPSPALTQCPHTWAPGPRRLLAARGSVLMMGFPKRAAQSCKLPPKVTQRESHRAGTEPQVCVGSEPGPLLNARHCFCWWRQLLLGASGPVPVRPPCTTATQSHLRQAGEPGPGGREDFLEEEELPLNRQRGRQEAPHTKTEGLDRHGRAQSGVRRP